MTVENDLVARLRQYGVTLYKAGPSAQAQLIGRAIEAIVVPEPARFRRAVAEELKLLAHMHIDPTVRALLQDTIKELQKPPRVI